MALSRTEHKRTAVAEHPQEKNYEGLTKEQLIQMYRLMFISRRLDDREILLKNQQKIFFRSPEPDMKPCWWPRASVLSLAMTGFIPTIATVRSHLRWE